jgi:Ca-activated chloride channel homolog
MLRIVGLLMTLAAGTTAAQTIFRSGIDLTTVNVTVSDRRGTYLTELTADDFVVLEDGKPQVIRYFARGEQGSSALETHVGLLFDTSGSMTDDITLARSAAIRFLNMLSDAADMTLVDFSTEVRIARYGQKDFPRVVERIRGRKPDGFTAMYDALAVYLDHASEDQGRTVLLLYTDGGDTRSTISFSDVMTLVRGSDVTIFPIGFLTHQRSWERIDQRDKLMRLAEASGGQAFFPVTMADVTAAYDKVVTQIRAQYTIGFSSTNTTADGRWRKVDVRLARQGLKDARILSRKGYFAPSQPLANAAGSAAR